ncbi:hypothetical protein ACLB2K_019833 [Fragaria x ananassa]
MCSANIGCQLECCEQVKIHGTCQEELDDTVKELEAATGSVVVGQIGRTVILYRPSLTKLKAEEKKEQMHCLEGLRTEPSKICGAVEEDDVVLDDSEGVLGTVREDWVLGAPREDWVLDGVLSMWLSTAEER